MTVTFVNAVRLFFCNIFKGQVFVVVKERRKVSQMDRTLIVLVVNGKCTQLLDQFYFTEKRSVQKQESKPLVALGPTLAQEASHGILTMKIFVCSIDDRKLLRFLAREVLNVVFGKI